MGYKEIASGNIRDCLYSDRGIDYSTWFVDRLGDLRCDAIHHDGTNHYLYRTYKPGVRESQIDLLKEKLYYGTATRADITRITRRLGDEIGKVYGWGFPSVGGRPCPWKGRSIMAQLPNVKLNVHPSMFDLMMAVLERNAAAEDVPTRNSAQDLMDKRMRFSRRAAVWAVSPMSQYADV